MALSLDLKVYTPPSVVKTPATRPQQNISGPSGDSTEKSAQAFIDSLPANIRERVARPNRDPQNKSGFNDAQKTKNDAPRITPDQIDTQATPQSRGSDLGARIFTGPISINSASLLQVQLEASASTQNAPLSPYQFERSHNAYLLAGAQPGGQASATKAALARDEQANKILIVPPVITRINLTT